jgi:tetratricopeptide (TPR) repeat protein
MMGSGAGAAEALCRRGLELLQAGQPQAAGALLEQALAADPQRFEALYVLGALCAQGGEAARGADLLRRAAAVNPTSGPAHSLLGAALLELKRPSEALAPLRRAIELNPADAEAWFSQGLALRSLGQPDGALASLDQAAALAPDFAEAHNCRGTALHELGRTAEALAAHESALALNPALAEAHNNRGVVLQALGRTEAAAAAYERAIALGAGDAATHNNLGLALCELQRFEAALASFDRAIALDPGDAWAHSNRGLALGEQDRLEDGIASLDAAVALSPQHRDALANRSYLLLMAGRFEEGWAAYEHRMGREDPQGPAFAAAHPWRGEALGPDHRLFVHHEQGFGDTIQFSRYVKLLAARGVEADFSVQAPLAPLLRQLSPSGRIFAGAEHPERFDYYCSQHSLPLLLGTRLETIPAWPQYLEADPERRRRFEARLGPSTQPRIGLAWSGSPTHKNDRNRSLRFEQLAPLLLRPAQWVCLQKDVRPADAAALAACGEVTFLGEALGDFADTAALIDLMDLVVTVDTSIAHLAGALGKPVWILLPYIPDWRWMLGRADSPWYPSARLFRQPSRGDWASVIEAVKGELAHVRP